MRRLASLLVPVLALSACYNAYRGPGAGPDSYRNSSDRWYDAADVPLAARIDQTGSSLGVRLNRPAYVALFEILPGQGVGLYYPAFGAERSYFASGFTMLPTHGARRFDSYYSSRQSRYNRGEPRFYLLVASRQPLRSINRFQRSDAAMHSVLGLTAYNTTNYRRVMEDLVDAVVPPQSDDDWTTDVLAVWPRNDSYYANNDDYRRVYCRDGSSQVLPIELAHWGCVRQDRPIVVRQPRTAATTPPPATGDSTRVNPPTRRRPEPATAGPTDEREDGGGSVPVRRPRPESVDRPAFAGPGDARTPSTREGTEERAERPRAEAPAREPRVPARTVEPRAETPRAEPTRSAPPARSESPRAEPVRTAPPARAEPAPARSAPAPAREESSRPVTPAEG
jgi:hypothetical protein